jgi:phenylalanine-4-hydroxylase
MEQHGISGNEIPQLSKLNEILQATTGFRIKPVSGILS